MITVVGGLAGAEGGNGRGMWDWIFGSWRTVGYVAVATVLIYLSTLVAIRLGERRTLTEMSAFDFVVAVAIGGIVARTATVQPPSYVQGLAALVTLLTIHHLLSWGRLHAGVVRWLTRREPLLLMAHGQPLARGLRQAHMSEEDLYTVLREHGVVRVSDVAAVVLEARGAFSVIVNPASGTVDSRLLEAVTTEG